MVSQMRREQRHLFGNGDDFIQRGFSPTMEKMDFPPRQCVLWEDDRYGRVTQTVDAASGHEALSVEIPIGHSPAGQTYWRALQEMPGANSETVNCLLTIIREMAGDVYSYTTPLRQVEAFSEEEEMPFHGLV